MALQLEIWKNRKAIIERDSKGKFTKNLPYSEKTIANLNIKPRAVKPFSPEIKIEKWKNGRFFVLRNKSGRIIDKRKVEKGLTKEQIKANYKQNKTFREDTKKQKLKNLSEYTRLKKSNIDSYKSKKPIMKAPTKNAQYVVQGYYKKQLIVGRSQKLGDKLAKNSQEAKEEAWENFLYLLGWKVTKKYDDNEGYKHLKEVEHLSEGWVYYR